MPRFPFVLLLVVSVACGGGDGEEGQPGPVQDLLALPPGLTPGVSVPEPAPVLERPALPVIDADHLAGFGDDSVRVYVLGVDAEYDDPSFLGVVVTCRDDSVEATVAHGLFPAGGAAPVRTVVEFPDGEDSEVFGPSRYPSGAEPVAHETVLRDPDDVDRLVVSAFLEGAVVSNGYRSFRNALPPDRNEAAAAEILGCPVFVS